MSAQSPLGCCPPTVADGPPVCPADLLQPAAGHDSGQSPSLSSAPSSPNRSVDPFPWNDPSLSSPCSELFTCLSVPPSGGGWQRGGAVPAPAALGSNAPITAKRGRGDWPRRSPLSPVGTALSSAVPRQERDRRARPDPPGQWRGGTNNPSSGPPGRGPPSPGPRTDMCGVTRLKTRHSATVQRGAVGRSRGPPKDKLSLSFGLNGAVRADVHSVYYECFPATTTWRYGRVSIVG